MTLYLLLLVLGLAAAFLADRSWRTRKGRGSRFRDQLPDDPAHISPEEERAAWAEHRGGFDVVLRGYRMDQVDRRIAELEQRVEELSVRSDLGGGSPSGSSSASVV